MCKFARNLSLSHHSVLVLVLSCLFSSISSPLIEDGFAMSNNALGRAVLVLPFGTSDSHPDAPFADAVLRLRLVLVFRHSEHSCCYLSFVRRHIASAESGQQIAKRVNEALVSILFCLMYLQLIGVINKDNAAIV